MKSIFFPFFNYAIRKYFFKYFSIKKDKETFDKICGKKKKIIDNKIGN